MTKFTQRSFTVHSPGGKQYADNWERTFGKQSTVESGFPDAPDEVLKRIAELHRAGDEKWADGKKDSADWCHREARELGEKYGLNPVRCDQCDVYMPVRDLAQHKADKHTP